MMRPTRVEPVKLIRRTAGWAISSSTTAPASAGSWTIRFTTPGGMPASWSAAAIAAWVRGHSSEALSTTVLPYASGDATARVPRITGAFHGAIPSTTPAGWRTPIASRPGMSDGITSPIRPYAWAAASRSIPAASAQLNMPHPNVPPVSSVTIAAISCERSSSTSAARASSARRWAGGDVDQLGNASAAASAARRASSGPAAATVLAATPSTGPELSQDRPELAGTHSPPISSRCCSSSTVAICLSLDSSTYLA
jgi:hypothetical protein